MVTKQEEIKAGLLKIIVDEQNYVTYEETRDQVIEYLHSQGVVIKTDRGLPFEHCPYKWKRGTTHPFEKLPEKEWVGWHHFGINLDNYGYVAVESLI